MEEGAVRSQKSEVRRQAGWRHGSAPLGVWLEGIVSLHQQVPATSPTITITPASSTPWAFWMVEL